MAGARSRSQSRDAKEAPVEDQKLASFRERYPVDDRAFDFLAKQQPEIQTAVVADFRPREEGQSDYSALLTNFVRRCMNQARARARPAPAPVVRGNQARWKDVRNVRQDASSPGRSPPRRRVGVRRKRRCRSRRRARGSSADGSVSIASNSDGSCDSEDRDRRLCDMLCSNSSAGGGSGGSGSSDESSVSCSLEDEARARKKTEYACARAVAAAQEDEQRTSQEEEEKAMKAAGEQVARVITVEDKTMKDKLREYEEMLNSEKMARIAEATKEAEAEAKARIKKTQEEAAEIRAEKVRRSQAHLEETLRTQKEDREGVKAKKQKSREEKAKAKEEKGAKAKKERRAKKAAKGSESDSPRREKRRRRKVRKAAPRERRRRRSRSRDGADSLSGSPGRSLAHRENAELLAFRERYPMDERAWGALCVSGAPLQRQLISQFKPRSEGDSDYSALISTFLRALLLRKQQSRPPGAAHERPRGPGGPGGEFSGRVVRQRAIQDEGRGRRDDSRSRSRSESRDRGPKRSSNGLEAFRDRYPMDGRAFDNLKACTTDIQAVVISDFKPRKEGENDYSALVMAFLRSVQMRVHTGRGPPPHANR